MKERQSQAIIDKAKSEVNGFRAIYGRLEQKVSLEGLSDSTLNNYGVASPRLVCVLNDPP